jgi:hypothetical protein
MASYSQPSADRSSVERLHAIVKLAVHGERPSVTQVQSMSFTPASYFLKVKRVFLFANYVFQERGHGCH